MPKEKVKNPFAVGLSAQRMLKLSPKRRREIAQHAARTRWSRKRKKGA